MQFWIHLYQLFELVKIGLCKSQQFFALTQFSTANYRIGIGSFVTFQLVCCQNSIITSYVIFWCKFSSKQSTKFPFLCLACLNSLTNKIGLKCDVAIPYIRQLSSQKMCLVKICKNLFPFFNEHITVKIYTCIMPTNTMQLYPI